jgi:hypothetical protein
MLSDADRDLLWKTSITGRLALALVCVERVIGVYQIQDERIQEFIELLWRFIESRSGLDFDAALRKVRLADLIIAVEFGESTPAAYASLPPFLPRLLYDTREVAVGDLYAALVDYSPYTFDCVVRVLDLCAQHGVPLPPIAVFARSHFSEAYGWGYPVSRSFFREALDKGDGDRQDTTT